MKDRGGQPCYDASTIEIPTGPRISFWKQALTTSHQIDCLVFEIKMPMGICVGNVINSIEILLHTIGGCWQHWVHCHFYHQLPSLIPMDMNSVLHHWLEDMCGEDFWEKPALNDSARVPLVVIRWSRRYHCWESWWSYVRDWRLWHHHSVLKRTDAVQSCPI